MKNIFDGGNKARFLFDEVGQWKHHNPIEESITRMCLEMERKKNNLVKQKLAEKGFEHLIANIETKRFPKVCCVIQDGWSYYYADNDTDEGCFIVAIEKLKVDNNLKEPFKITVSFRYQDSYNGEIKML